jgi:hypothetical protein
MKRFIFLFATLAIMSLAAFAGDPVGTVKADENGQSTVVVAVSHDTTTRSADSLTSEELAYIDSVPEFANGNLHAAVTEMLLANVCHVPESGKFIPNSSERLWGIYQAWAGSAKAIVSVTVIKGDKGDKGETGEQGIPRPPGPAGLIGPQAEIPAPLVMAALAAQPTTIINKIYMVSPVSYRTRQMGGEYEPTDRSTTLLSVTLKEVMKVNATANANANAEGGAGGQGGQGGAGGSVGDITLDNSNDIDIDNDVDVDVENDVDVDVDNNIDNDIDIDVDNSHDDDGGCNDNNDHDDGCGDDRDDHDNDNGCGDNNNNNNNGNNGNHGNNNNNNNNNGGGRR